MKIHKDVEKGNFVIYLIRPELMLKEKSDLWVINSMKIGDECAAYDSTLLFYPTFRPPNWRIDNNAVPQHNK